jgi:hypothetical protein
MRGPFVLRQPECGGIDAGSGNSTQRLAMRASCRAEALRRDWRIIV